MNAGDNVSVTATFSERIFIVDNSSGNPEITLAVGSDNRTATYASGGDNSTAMVFRYMIQDGDTDSNGISIRSDALALNSSTIRDAALNNAILTLIARSDNDDYIVDTTPPTVSSVAITSATNKQYDFVNATDVVSVTATFSETFPSAVIVDNASGNPTLPMVVGSTNRPAGYTSGSNTNASGNASLVFQYTIQSGDTDPDGISIEANVLALNSGTIMDRAGNFATDLTHSAVDDNSSVKVDTTPPSVTTFEMDDIEIKTNETATVTLEFSEPVCTSTILCTQTQTGGTYFNNDDITVIGDNGTGVTDASGSLSTMES
ncbi:MAG: hypothetical protein VYA36_01425, partial [Pseudomonadota bacterium]|nr:hypothetical protein [Pseudomonadota bacterium]